MVASTPVNPITRRVCAVILATVAAFAFTGPSYAKELTKASLRLKWLASAQFAGYYVAKDKGWYEAEGIDLAINPGGPNIIGENLVASGVDTFGHAGGAATLLQARSKSLPLAGIAMMFQETPYLFVAREKSGIKSLSDFQGKTVTTWFTGPQFMLQALLKAKNVPLDKVRIQAQSASMVPFIEGKIDVATVTLYNELPALKREGITDLTLFNPATMGVNLPNEVIIVNEKFAKDNQKLVQSFLNASLRGWSYALGHPKEAIDIVMKAIPAGNRIEQEEQVPGLTELILAGPGTSKGIGYIDMDALKFTNTFLVENGVIPKPVDVASAVDLSFWANVPEQYKKVTK
jgi:NitT/TauT family transport system substrate-binding protein